MSCRRSDNSGVVTLLARLEAVVAATAAGRLLPGVRRCLLRVESRHLSDSWSGTATTHSADPAPPAPDAAFRIASVSKMVTAATLLALVDEGRCRLDDTIGRHLPRAVVERVHRFQGRSYGHLITLRQLLDHTSGLPDFFLLPPVQEAIRGGPGAQRFTPLALVDLAASGGAPAFKPGEGRSYTDTGFVLGGLVIEAATQVPLQDAYRSYVLEPAGMSATWLESSTDPPRCDAVLPHDLDGSDISGMEPTVDWGGGGLVSTTADLAAFLRALVEGRLVSASSWHEMTRWLSGPEGYYDQYGLGVGRYNLGDAQLIGHHGIWGAFAFWAPELEASITGTVSTARIDRRPLLKAVVTALST